MDAVPSDFFISAHSYLQAGGMTLLKPIFWIQSKLTKKQIVPPINNKILLLSAKKLAEKIRKQELTSEQIVEIYINRIKEINPIVNAVVEDRFKLALEDARKVDEYIKSNKKSLEEIENDTPLLGVPITIKESCKVQGMSYTGCSLVRNGIKASEDGDSVKLIRKAGAIPLAVTNTPELCLNWETHNFIVGKTLNPYDNTKTPGGSSGGEAALLGSAASVIGMGSDIAGSIRLPSAFCGIFGHKPSKRIVSINGHYPQSEEDIFYEFLVLGPMCRYSEDLSLMMKIISGNNLNKLQLDKKVDFSKMNIYYMEDSGKSFTAIPVEDEIKNSIRNSAQYFKQKYNTKISNEKIPFIEKATEMCIGMFSQLNEVPDILQNSENPKESDNLGVELVKSCVRMSNYTGPALLFYALMKSNFFISYQESKIPIYKEARKNLFDIFQSKLSDNGVFLFPTFPSGAIEHNSSFLYTDGVLYTMLFNILGLPATHVPLGLNKNGLPIGVQVVAGLHQDHNCFAVAKELEKAFGGWKPPCQINV